jgi:predicted nucleic acid-binding Zn ribbon protein
MTPPTHCPGCGKDIQGGSWDTPDAVARRHFARCYRVLAAKRRRLKSPAVTCFVLPAGLYTVVWGVLHELLK